MAAKPCPGRSVCAGAAGDDDAGVRGVAARLGGSTAARLPARLAGVTAQVLKMRLDLGAIGIEDPH
jgi:hypothetical protein